MTAKYTFRESDVRGLTKSVPNDPKLHALVGNGYGNIKYTHADLSYMGLWIQDVYDVDNGFADDLGILKTYTDDEFWRRWYDYQYKFILDYYLEVDPGDIVKIIPERWPAEELKVVDIKYSSEGTTEIELGVRTPNNADKWEPNQDIGKGFTSHYLTVQRDDIECNAEVTFQPKDPEHMVVDDGEIVFTLDEGILDDAVNPRVTLALTMNNEGYTLEEGEELDYGDMLLGRAAMRLLWDDVYIPNGCISGFGIGYSIPEIDVTDFLTEDDDNTVAVDLALATEVPREHNDYTGHPNFSLSGTLHFWRRAYV